MSDDLADLKAEALRFANSIRGEAGLPPVVELSPGFAKDTHLCPLARTLESTWGVNYPTHLSATVLPSSVELRRWDGYNRRPDKIVAAKTSPGARAFVNAVDDAQFPELVKRSL